MHSNIELPSGKVFNLDRFVALLPTEDTDEGQYSLILEGYSQTIYLNQTEADMVRQKLKLKSNSHINGSWDREEQIRKNQPKLKLLKEWIERDKNRQETPESIAEFEAFKKIIDAERPSGQKLYEE
jgi:hypothetical protein